MRKSLVRKALRGALVALIGIALGISIALMINSTNVSAEQKEEERIRSLVAGEFEDMNEVEYLEKHTGIYGESKSYVIYGDKGTPVGFVGVDVDSGEISAIGHSYSLSPGGAGISLDQAKKIALEYLSKWDYQIGDDFILIKGALEERWGDIGDKRGYIYQFEWRRCIGDITILDGCYIEMDASNGDIIMCCFPHRDCKIPDIEEIVKGVISRDEAISRAKESIPSVESFYGRMPTIDKSGLHVSESAERYYEPVYGEPTMTWRVTISYEYVLDEEGLYDKTFYVTIDANDGKTLEIDQTE